MASAIKREVAAQGDEPAEAGPIAAPLTPATIRPAPEVVPLQPSRAGKVQVNAYLSPEYRDTLKIIAIENRKTSQTLLCEALNMLFDHYRKPQLPVE